MDGHLGTVVIGEPDQAMSVLYQRALGAVFTVLAAPDHATILELLRSRPLVAVIVEPVLFPTDSWVQTETVSRACARAGVPLVICSTQDERRKGRDLGAAAYLVKPTLPATLLDIVCQVVKPTTG
jgi:DNA-binding response OmpR family regulator